MGGNRSPSPRMHDTLDEATRNFSIADKRNSVKIGLNPTGPFSSLDSMVNEDEGTPDERITIAKEYKSAKETLKATG